jgi:hypothetical protein
MYALLFEIQNHPKKVNAKVSLEDLYRGAPLVIVPNQPQRFDSFCHSTTLDDLQERGLITIHWRTHEVEITVLGFRAVTQLSKLFSHLIREE